MSGLLAGKVLLLIGAAGAVRGGGGRGRLGFSA
jgi:hypothetical protein